MNSWKASMKAAVQEVHSLSGCEGRGKVKRELGTVYLL